MNEEGMPAMKRYDMVYFLEANYCNPNGDPDMDNMPRVDPHSRCGLMTPQSLKRKIRDYAPQILFGVDTGTVELPPAILQGATRSPDKGYDIYMKSLHNLKLRELRVSLIERKAGNKMPREQMLAKHYYDVRTFGAVLTSAGGDDEAEDNVGLVGPVQVSYGVSLKPVNILRIGTTVTFSREKIDMKGLGTVEDVDAKQQELLETSPGSQRTMGRGYIIDHGVYKFTIGVDPFRAEHMGFDQFDLALFVRTLIDWPNLHWTSSKTGMKHRKLFIFEHSSPYGNMPIWDLERLIRTEDLTIDASQLPADMRLYEL